MTASMFCVLFLSASEVEGWAIGLERMNLKMREESNRNMCLVFPYSTYLLLFKAVRELREQALVWFI